MVPHQGAEYCRGYVNLNLNESNACEVTHKQTFSDCVSKSEGKQEKILHDVPKCPTKMMMFGVTPFPSSPFLVRRRSLASSSSLTHQRLLYPFFLARGAK